MRVEIGAWLKKEELPSLSGAQEVRGNKYGDKQQRPAWMCPVMMHQDFSQFELIGINNNHHSFGGYTLGIQAVGPLPS